MFSETNSLGTRLPTQKGEGESGTLGYTAICWHVENQEMEWKWKQKWKRKWKN